jgi:putative membrane protein
MNIIDYLLLGAFAAAALYTGYRLLRGWLRTPSHEIVSETSNRGKPSMRKIIALTITTAALAAFTTVHAKTAPTAAPPNDAQIAQIVLTADSVDVDYGNLAVKKTKNAEVKAFAETMIRDHTAVNAKATALAKKLGMTPEASDTSKSLKSDGEKEMAKLQAMHGADFDKAYIDNEVAYHESVIGALDKVLLPNAKNAELKSLLESGRPIFQSHLEHAKTLQASLNK